MRTLSAFSLTILLLGPVTGAVAGSYEDLQKNISSAFPALTQIQSDEADQSSEQSLESHDELFPADSHGSGAVRKEDPLLSAFISFRVNDVPYVLKDVPSSAWFAPYVRDMAERGIVSGYKDSLGVPTGVFSPEKSVTLEELSKMAVQASGVTLSSCPSLPKNPLAAGAWSAPYVSCAESHTFALYADGTVDIHRPATRSEVVMTVLQAFGVQLQDPDPVKPLFKDVSASTLFAPAIATAVRDGIVSGYMDTQGRLTGYFGPDKPINRAEVCKMLSIALQLYVKK